MEAPQPILSGFASEQGHFYQQDGSPAYEVSKAPIKGKCPICTGARKSAADKARTAACTTCDEEGYVYTENPEKRPTHLGDAKKLDLGRGVTTIIRVMAAPGLERWKREQLKEAVFTAPAAELEGLQYPAWSAKVEQWATEHARSAAAVGTAIHATIEKGLLGENLEGYQYRAWFEAFVLECRSVFGQVPDFEAEKSYASRFGYGCKVDAVHRGAKILLDLKTKNFKNKEGVLVMPTLEDEHHMQLAGNSNAAGLLQESTFHGIAFIDRETPVCKILPASAEQIQRGWQMFWHCLAISRLQDQWIPSWGIEGPVVEG